MSPSLQYTVQPVSFVVREYVRERLLDNTDGFNALFPLVAAKYGVRPVTLRLTGNPPTLFLGRYDLDTLVRVVGNNEGIYAVLSIGKLMGLGRGNTRVTPSSFSGGVPVALDFYTVTVGGTTPPDAEAMWFSLEESIIGTFNGRGGAMPVPMGVSYNNEIEGDPGRFQWDGTRFVQVISFTLMYSRITYGF